MTEATTIGELKRSGWTGRVSVKEEMRRNLLKKLAVGETLFPGVLGYDDSVIPQVVNAILSRHNMILLGLRGQDVRAATRTTPGYLRPAAGSRSRRRHSAPGGRSVSTRRRGAPRPRQWRAWPR